MIWFNLNFKNLTALTFTSVVFLAVLSMVIKSRMSSTGMHPDVKAAGDPIGFKMRMLSFGAKLLQSKGPVKGFDLYIIAYHPLKEDPDHQFEVRPFHSPFSQVLFTSLVFWRHIITANK